MTIFNKLLSVFGLTTLPPKPKKVKKKRKLDYTRKKHDTTVFSQSDYDFIMRAHEEHQQYNFEHPDSRVKQLVLVAKINTALGLNKSKSALAQVWLGRINRDDLGTERNNH